MLFCGATIQYFREKALSSFLQLLGAGCLVIVVITHIFEALRVIPWMQWGMQHSIGHCLDLCSAVLALTLFPAGYLLQALAKQH
jgi:succinate dehydrogenase/fumarate reductase cytochrome b subunit